MMHVEFLPNIRFCRAASLASIGVSFSGLASLSAPIRSIIGFIPPTPSWIMDPYPKGVAAIKRAKSKTRFALASPCWVIKSLAAIGTHQPMMSALSFGSARCLYHGRLALWCVGVWFAHFSRNDAQGASCVKTATGTNIDILGSLNLSRRTCKRLATYWAYQFYAGTHFLCSQFVRAITRAGGLPSVLKACLVSFVEVAADRTFAIGEFSHRASIAQMGFMGKRWDIGGRWLQSRLSYG